MASFRDKSGRSWDVDLTFGAILRVRSTLSIDLQDVVDDKKLDVNVLYRIMRDPELLVKVILVVCAAQAKAEQIDESAMLDSLSGEALAEMANAFLEALVNFSQGRRKEILRLILEKSAAALEATNAAAIQKLAALDVSAMAAKLREKSGNSPASSESTPDLLPSVNSP